MVSSKPKWWLGSTGSMPPLSSQCVTPGIGSTPTISTLSSLKSLSLHKNLSGLFLISGLSHPFSIGFAATSYVHPPGPQPERPVEVFVPAEITSEHHVPVPVLRSIQRILEEVEEQSKNGRNRGGNVKIEKKV
ncbi:hypothetical protein OsJ_24403 [Oryza sativa Japonica Group]|jgi:hypothetical protein|uniref:Uncharacterized protein n=1 Tax=Oryza sativa subsp. japonica TaxID=39947 RepID=A3BK77_ORYSJ|nr:uncharacterized protein LOC112939606 [Oryza sativa Japonica Group]EAZ39966.1 hypothetical protein OsJ_24403 [Oryza sativa Japonica Group]